MKQFRIIIVVGRKGSGKSYYIKEKLKHYKGNKLILDVRREYAEGILVKPSKFMEMVKNAKNSLIIFEEATMYMSNKSDFEDIRWLNMSARHDGNTIFYVFHALQFVPLNILNQADLLILHRTGDNFELVNKKFKGDPRIMKAFFQVRNSSEKHVRVRVPMQ